MELQWPLILFTTLLAWAAGVFGAQCFYALRGRGAKAQMPALITSAVLLVVGGIAVFFHLEHWERIFNGFGHLSSGITQELIAIVVLAVVMVIYFVYLRRSGDDAKVPTWLAVAGIVMAVVLVAVMGHSYMMASLPAWDSVLQIGSLLGAACGLGPATMAIIAEAVDEAYPKTGLTVLVGTVVNAVTTVAYAIAMEVSGGSFVQIDYYFDPTDPTRPMVDAATQLSAFNGESAVFVWAAIIVGALIPLALGIWRAKSTESWKLFGALIVLCVLVGAVALRMVFYLMGTSVFMLY